jgi:nucleotide-binding universal stress UspA family protein
MEAAKAMRRFVQMRLWPDVTFEIAHFGSDTVKGEELLAAASDYCEAHGYEAEVTFLEDNPDSGILAYAQRSEADIVVMGNSIKSLLFRHIIGGTVLSTIQKADRPLFLAQ